MARASSVVVLALLMFAVIGLASAAEKSSPSDASADDYDEDYSIDDIRSGASANGVVAAPLGGPVPPGAFDHAKGGVPSTTSATTAASSSSSVHFSAVAGVASAALAAAFYF
ncbi:uncharacterized protein LOC114178531 [Vigna unguiculata]|uniref:Uncharacterized protein n=1 Tax=Vigna unguiculata TaxID=3917 RepID=A0A4D6L893_VIGUN|nr:uncharacterized protein LOC114178531 [Vigna unguiculata]QCD84634.1 hypothetical protein DEO72_LG2g4989 [Vigna unguiculata]